jgi:hypothetical protein
MKKSNLQEELLRQIEIMFYGDMKDSMLETKNKLVFEAPKDNKVVTKATTPWKDTDEGKNVISFLEKLMDKSRLLIAGWPGWDAMGSSNQAYTWYALYAMRALTNYRKEMKAPRLNCVHVSKFSTGHGGIQTDSYDLNFVQEMKKKLPDPIAQTKFEERKVKTPKGVETINYTVPASSVHKKEDFTCGNTFYLWDFEIDFGKFTAEYKNQESTVTSSLFPDGAYNFFTQWFGSDNMYTIKSSLDRIPVADIACVNGIPMDMGSAQKKTADDNRKLFSDEAREWLHDNSMWITITAAVVGTLVGGPLGLAILGAGVTVDLADSYAYYEEGNTFMAGLTFIFAVLPFDKVYKMASPVVKKGLNYLKPLFDGTVHEVDEVAKYAKRLADEGYLPGIKAFLKSSKVGITAMKGLYKQTFLAFWKKASLYQVTKMMMWLIEKGYLLVGQGLKVVVVMLGFGVTWFTVAKMCGIPTPLDAPTQEAEGTPVEDETPMFKETFDQLAKFNVSLGYKSTIPSLFIMMTQLFLEAYGYNYWLGTEDLSDADTLNVLYNFSPEDIESITPTGGSYSDEIPTLSAIYDLPNQLNKPVSWQTAYIQKEFPNFERTNFESGKYNSEMEKAIKTFQMKNNLTVDGVLGKDTLNAIVKDINSRKIPLRSTFMFDRDFIIAIDEGFTQLGIVGLEKRNADIQKLKNINYDDLEKEYLKKDKTKDAENFANEADKNIDEDMQILNDNMELILEEMHRIEKEKKPTFNSETGSQSGDKNLYDALEIKK